MDIKYVCSLGPLCCTANFMKKTNLKLVSYPFDWIHSTPDILLHCLQDDFKTFLDKQYLTRGAESSNNTHMYYYKSGLNVFNHHNPANESDYNYFLRCIHRFKAIIGQTREKTVYNHDIGQMGLLWYRG